MNISNIHIKYQILYYQLKVKIIGNYMKNHAMLDVIDGVQYIQLLEDEYAGMVISYGKVSFKDECAGDCTDCSCDREAHKVLEFNYTIHDDMGIQYDKVELESYLGEFLCEIIDSALEDGTTIYTGGDDTQISD